MADTGNGSDEGGRGGDGAAGVEHPARVLDANPDPILSLDGQGRILVANRAARLLAGSGTRPVGRAVVEVLGERFGGSVAALARQAAATGEATGELTHPGTGTTFSARAFACDGGACLFLRSLGDEGPPTLMGRPRIAEAQLLALFDHAPVGLAYFDRSHRVTRINTWMARVLNRPVEDIVGRRPDEFLLVTADRITAGLTDIFATATAPPVQEISVEDPYQPGVRRDFLLGWFPVMVDGAMVNAGAVVTEITALRAAEAERQRLADALDRERRLLHAVVEHMPVGVIAVQMPDGSPVLENTEAERLLGRRITSVQDMNALGPLVGVPPDGRPHVPEDNPISQALQTGRATGVEEVNYRRPDGTMTTFAVRAAPVVEADERIRLSVATFQDISHRKAMEEALRAAKESAERADLAKSRFLAAASHDLRQPLQSLFFFSESLRGHVAGDVGTRRLRQLRQALGALKGLLDSLLDVSRLEANMVEPSIQDVDLTALLTEIRDHYEPVAADRGLGLRLEAQAQWGRSDHTLLGRILRNLLENALRYTRQGEIVMVCRRDGEEAVRLSVRDTGIGIPPEHLERIWEEFHQVDSTARDRGLGLGLAIVRRLSDLLGHRVTLHSEAGVGSEFSIILPAGQPRPAAYPAGPAAEPEGTPAAGARLLVIDDDAMVLMGTQAQLEEWGYESIGAVSAEEAVEAVRGGDRCPDLILADYRLRAGEVGTDAVTRVRSVCGPVPAVILTGETAPETQRAITAAGLGLLHKPTTPSQLRRVLAEYLEATPSRLRRRQRRGPGSGKEPGS